VVGVNYQKIKEAVLGKRYELSVAFLPPAEMRKVARRALGRDKASNVFAFPLSKTSGEILLCKSASKPFTVEYLFIHGLLHIKGLKHGVIMEREERQILKKFGLKLLCKQQSRVSTSGHTT